MSGSAASSVLVACFITALIAIILALFPSKVSFFPYKVLKIMITNNVIRTGGEKKALSFRTGQTSAKSRVPCQEKGS